MRHRALLAAGASGWTPASHANKYAWFPFDDTSKIAHVAGVVTQVDDSSGNGRHISCGSGSAAYAPITATRTVNGLNVLDYNNNLLLLDIADLAQPFTLYAVAKFDTVGAAEADLFGWHDVNLSCLFQKSGKWGMYQGSTDKFASGASDTSLHLFAAVFNGSNSAIYVDGASTAISDTGTLALKLLLIGAGSGSAPITLGQPRLGMDGAFCEAFVASSADDATAVATFRTYAQSKWGTP